MARFHDELLNAARQLLARRSGQRGKLFGARVRRSVSTSYYALFHFLIEEASVRLLGSGSELLHRRRLFARTFSHAAMKSTFEKIRDRRIDASVVAFLKHSDNPEGLDGVPKFAANMARVFCDAQLKRHAADYDMNAPASEADAQMLARRVADAIATWRAADAPADRDFKRALCALMALKGQLRREL